MKIDCVSPLVGFFLLGLGTASHKTDASKRLITREPLAPSEIFYFIFKPQLTITNGLAATGR